MFLMRIVGPDLLGSGQLRTLRNIIGRLSEGGELDAICMLLSGFDRYLVGDYDAAQHLLDRGQRHCRPTSSRCEQCRCASTSRSARAT